MAEEIIVVLRVPPDQLRHLRAALRNYAALRASDANFNPEAWAFVLADHPREGEPPCPNS